MNRILSIIQKEDFRCLPCDRLNLDIDRFAEYRDSDEHRAETPFERPVLSAGKRRVNEIGRHIPTILHYFLDGSRRTYKIADIILDGRYLPLIAGQIGVAVVRRRGDRHGVEPVREFCLFENVIAFPELVGPGDLKYLQDQINKLGSIQFVLLSYEVKTDRDLVDLGIARIMSKMHDLEIAVVHKMAEQHLLGNESLLVIDGPLRFKKRFDLVQFRNVVGLSKTFRPSFSLGKGRLRKDVGSITSELDFGERTSVFKTMEEEKTIGMWYLRIRPPRMMANPLQGIVKMECYAIEPEDKEDGLDAERIDIISKHVLRERNVTPYGADLRWASHIYPIYMAESYIKASFMSDIHFKALF